MPRKGGLAHEEVLAVGSGGQPLGHGRAVLVRRSLRQRFARLNGGVGVGTAQVGKVPVDLGVARHHGCRPRRRLRVSAARDEGGHHQPHRRQTAAARKQQGEDAVAKHVADHRAPAIGLRIFLLPPAGTVRDPGPAFDHLQEQVVQGQVVEVMDDHLEAELLQVGCQHRVLAAPFGNVDADEGLDIRRERRIVAHGGDDVGASMPQLNVRNVVVRDLNTADPYRTYWK